MHKPHRSTEISFALWIQRSFSDCADTFRLIETTFRFWRVCIPEWYKYVCRAFQFFYNSPSDLMITCSQFGTNILFHWNSFWRKPLQLHHLAFFTSVKWEHTHQVTTKHTNQNKTARWTGFSKFAQKMSVDMKLDVREYKRIIFQGCSHH